MRKYSDLIYKIIVIVLLIIILTINIQHDDTSSTSINDDSKEKGRYKEVKIKKRTSDGSEYEDVRILDTETGRYTDPN